MRDRAVHLRLPVSFFIVISVVEQGQWKSMKTTVQIAVKGVQPLARKTSLAAVSDAISVKCSAPEYTIIAMGKTISLAGSPNINAVSSTPSNPIKVAKGSKNSVK